jgi:hypothetical protein
MIIGADGNVVSTIAQKTKNAIVDIRLIMFPKMMVHPETKQMVMVPMQDIQYQREGSDEWFSMPMIQVEKHEFNPENKNEEDLLSYSNGVS